MIDINHPVWLEHVQKTQFEHFGRAHLMPVLGGVQRTGIFNSDGRHWQVQRKAATHAFSRNHFKGPIRDKIGAHVKLVVDLFDNLAATGQVFDFQDVMARFTMLLSLAVAFSEPAGLADCLTADPACLERRYEFVDAFDEASPLIDSRNRNALWQLTERTTNRGHARAIQTAVDAIYDFINPLVTARLATTKAGVKNRTGDLLDLFMEHESDPWTLSGWMASMLFAGRDTTAFTITWQMYELLRPGNASQNLLARARAEVAELGHQFHHSAKDADTLDYDDIKGLTLLNAMWQETTRVHPAAARGTPTVCYRDTVLPAIADIAQPAVVVRRGDVVIWQGEQNKKKKKKELECIQSAELPLSDWVYNRLPEVWGDDCLDYRPERFLDGATGSLRNVSMWTWHSFNAGPRTCLGKTLATFEALSLLTALLPRYDFEMADPGMQAKYTTGLNMGIEQGLRLRVRRRE